ncbi:hypothetical protein [uncultured Parasphingorhabdus sp.]|uniref:hypothetical protein n=1 Tax=uncultured Parasphingorhabdus sp. TaxID=2709694 RepID=UPI002AA90BE7|nr:hypothetical protein [uncultured Parasphingorhabdus sp.]
MAYHKLPWKRNFQKVPAHIEAGLAEIDGELVVIAATKRIARADIERGIYAHVGLRAADGAITTAGPVLPPADYGKWSERNAFGWDRKRTDWPKVTKTYVFETPNFGDAATYGTHMHVWEREVYQHQVFEPQGMMVESEVLQDNGGDDVAIKFTLTPFLERGQPEFELMLLWSLNVLQENTGTIGVFKADATRDDYVSTIMLDWQIFPPGTVDEVIERLTQRPANPSNAPDFDEHVRDRVQLFAQLNPTAYIRGQGGFGSYFGAQFADDLVVFENLKYGNAVYVLYQDWDTITQRSRYELLRDQDADFDRIIHSDDWKERLAKLLNRKLRERGLGRQGRGLFSR